MSSKVVIPILLLGVIGVTAILLTHPGSDTIPAPLPANGIDAVPAPETAMAEGNNNSGAERDSETVKADPAVAQESHEDYVARRVAELMDLAMSDDILSLQSILSELNNADREIREAAVTAAVQFKSLEAIPGLQAAAAVTEDVEEKVALLKAIEFLSLINQSELITEK